MKIDMLYKNGTLDVLVQGHTSTDICNGVSCLLWSLAAYGINYAVEEHTFTSGNSHIRIHNCPQAIADFIETAFEQIAFNEKNIQFSGKTE